MLARKLVACMDVFWIVVVILLLVAAFGYAGYLYIKEAGPESLRLWLTGSRLFRITPSGSGHGGAMESHAADTAPMNTGREIEQEAMQLAAQDRRAAIDSDALRHLKEEFQRDLVAAVGRSREFDARLSRVELSAAPDPAIGEEIASIREIQQTEIGDLRQSMESLRERIGTYGERRGEALSALYSSLARVESSLAAVVNPMLLPGESLTLPTELPQEAYAWSNWGDVGERAYAFGNVFNENRLVLERSTADAIANFIATLRTGLTGSIYPAVRGSKPGADQIVQMRSGLGAIIAALPEIREQIENAYRDER